MRSSTLGTIGALLLAFPGPAAGQSGQQTQTASTAASTSTQVRAPLAAASGPKLGQVDFGFRKDTDRWAFFSAADNVGYEDQSFRGEFEATGRLKTGFLWTQIPLFISERTASL